MVCTFSLLQIMPWWISLAHKFWIIKKNCRDEIMGFKMSFLLSFPKGCADFRCRRLCVRVWVLTHRTSLTLLVFYVLGYLPPHVHSIWHIFIQHTVPGFILSTGNTVRREIQSDGEPDFQSYNDMNRWNPSYTATKERDAVSLPGAIWCGREGPLNPVCTLA